MTQDLLASAAVKDILTGMAVGLGTGRAATRAIRALAERAAAERLALRCVATSKASHDLAAKLGLTGDDTRKNRGACLGAPRVPDSIGQAFVPAG